MIRSHEVKTRKRLHFFFLQARRLPQGNLWSSVGRKEDRSDEPKPEGKVKTQGENDELILRRIQIEKCWRRNNQEKNNHGVSLERKKIRKNETQTPAIWTLHASR